MTSTAEEDEARTDPRPGDVWKAKPLGPRPKDRYLKVLSTFDYRGWDYVLLERGDAEYHYVGHYALAAMPAYTHGFQLVKRGED